MTAFLFELDCASAAVAPAYEPYHDPYGCDVIRHVTRLLLRRLRHHPFPACVYFYGPHNSNPNSNGSPDSGPEFIFTHFTTCIYISGAVDDFFSLSFPIIIFILRR